MAKNIRQFVARFKRYFKTLKGVMTGPDWSGRVGWVAQVDVILSNSAKIPLRFSLTLVTTPTEKCG